MDILLFGRESAGVPTMSLPLPDARLGIPIKPGLRSLNVAMAAAMALGEALRQTSPATAAQELGSADGHVRNRGSQGTREELVRALAR